MLPAQLKCTFRTAKIQTISVVGINPGGALGFTVKAFLQSLAWFDTATGNTFPGSATAFSFGGGLLPFFYNYDKATVTQTRIVARLTNMGQKVVATQLQNDVATACTVVSAIVDTSAAAQMTYATGDQDQLERLRDLPFSKVKQLGNPKGGHDVVTFSHVVDHEKFLGAPLDQVHAATRTGPNLVLPNPFLGSQTGTPSWVLQVLLPFASTSATVQNDWRLEFELDQTVLFDSLRPLPKKTDDIQIAFTIVSGAT